MQATQTELKKIQEFLEIVSKTDFSPYSIYWVKYLQAQQPAGDLIQILNEEYGEQVLELGLMVFRLISHSRQLYSKR